MGIAPQEEMPHPPLSAFDGRPHSFFLARWRAAHDPCTFGLRQQGYTDSLGQGREGSR